MKKTMQKYVGVCLERAWLLGKWLVLAGVTGVSLGFWGGPPPPPAGGVVCKKYYHSDADKGKCALDDVSAASGRNCDCGAVSDGPL